MMIKMSLRRDQPRGTIPVASEKVAQEHSDKNVDYGRQSQAQGEDPLRKDQSPVTASELR